MKIPNNTLQSVVEYFNSELKNIIKDSELEAMLPIVLEHFLGVSKVDAVLNPSQKFSESDLLKIIFTVKELKMNKPLAYILGEWEFYGLRFFVNENTLIPRPETEELVHLIIEQANKESNISILDIGTGSGCIALALKNELPNAELNAWDVSEEAINIVRKNADLNKLNIIIEQVDILVNKDVLLPSKLDIIVSNPPYIPVQEKALMHSNVLDFEPDLALFVADTEPLLFYITIADFAKNNLKKGGKLYFEINENYGAETQEMLINKGFNKVLVVKDLNGKDRMIECLLN